METRTMIEARVLATLLAAASTFGAALAQSHAEGGLAGGGAIEPGRCLSGADHALVARNIAAYEREYGPLSSPDASVPAKFTFYPMAGNLNGDLWIHNYVDLEPSSGILDWDCTGYTYNGHDATDTLIRTFGEQLVGVPLYAALDGTVISVHDGEFDMNTSCTGTGNHVIIDHGNGRVCRYWHFKKNSIIVSVGQGVKAGQQLGLTGSSGCSTYPHLHFSTHDNSVLVEPYAGPCRPGPSEWVDQAPIFRDPYLSDFNITDVDISAYPGLPFDMPRAGTFVMGGNAVRFWLNVHNQPSGSTWRVRFRRPDASIAYDSGTSSFGNPFHRFAWWWWAVGIDLNQLGTWKIVFTMNGQNLVEAPFDVVATAGDVVNRAPHSISAQIEPASPSTEDVLICRVGTDLLLDDQDYDIVRYRYVWTIDGAPVRDVTTAAHSDVLQRQLAPSGSSVECTVTPSDGIASGPAASDQVTVCDTVVYCGSNFANVAAIAADTCGCAAGSIQVSMSGAPANQFGYLLIGSASGTVTDPPGAEGDLCLVGAPIGRYTADAGVTDVVGGLTTDILNAASGGGGGNIPNPPGGNVCSPPGQTWNFQYWHRDGMNPSRFSNAVSVTFF